MTSRERVLKVINLQEPDRVPADMGGSIMRGIMSQALDRLRKYLKLEERGVTFSGLYHCSTEIISMISHLPLYHPAKAEL